MIRVKKWTRQFFEILNFLSSAKHMGEECSGPSCLGGGLRKSGKQEREVTCKIYFPSAFGIQKSKSVEQLLGSGGGSGDGGSRGASWTERREPQRNLVRDGSGSSQAPKKFSMTGRGGQRL